jgi:hypothetical protein
MKAAMKTNNTPENELAQIEAEVTRACTAALLCAQDKGSPQESWRRCGEWMAAVTRLDTGLAKWSAEMSRTQFEKFLRQNTNAIQRIENCYHGAKGRRVRYELVSSLLFSLGDNGDGFDAAKLLDDPNAAELVGYITDIRSEFALHTANN